MTEPLALKYRPTEFADLIGQRLNGIVLQRMTEQDRLPSGLLFSGPSGTGKTTAARVVALKLTSDAIEIDAASHGGVQDVRELIETLRYSDGQAHRIVILDEAHSMSREAFNALLKTLEEPPPGVVFILASTEPEKIPETVKTRLIEFEFRRVSAHDLLERITWVVAQESIDIAPELLAYISERADGSVRRALMILDQIVLAEVATVDQYTELVGEYDGAPKLITALMTGDHALIFEELDMQLTVTANPETVAAQLVACLRDLLVLRAKGTPRATGVALEARRDLALRLDTERIVASLRRLWNLKAQFRSTGDSRGDLELSMVLMSEVLHDKLAPIASVPVVTAPSIVQPSPEPVVAVPRKLSLSELKRR